MKLSAQLEALLFAVGKPLSRASVMKALSCTDEELTQTIEALATLRNREDSGIHLMQHEETLSLVTAKEAAPILAAFAKEEVSGELTRPQLETLAIIAYRGPITQPEIEQIRGVNCSLILRNLLQRDLIIETPDVKKLQPVYGVSEAFLRHLGVHALSELPSYEGFAHHEEMDRLLAELSLDTTV